MLIALRTMLGSKKFIGAIAGVITAAALKVGLELPTEAVAAVVSPLIAYILGQGVADIGKNANLLITAAAASGSLATLVV